MTRILVVTSVEAERSAVRAGLGRTVILGAGALDAGRTDIGAGAVGAGAVGAGAVGAGAVGAGAVGSGDVGAIDVVAGGVGPAAAACAGARIAIASAAGRPYDMVISAGIAGGFPGRASIGDVVVGTASIAADLGADAPGGFLPLSQLGFGSERIDADPDLARRLVKAILDVAEISAAPASWEAPGADRDDIRQRGTVRAGEILSVSTVTGTAARAAELAGRHPGALAEAMEGYGVACAACAAGIPFAEIRTISNAVGPRDRQAWRIPHALACLQWAAAGLGTLVG